MRTKWSCSCRSDYLTKMLLLLLNTLLAFTFLLSTEPSGFRVTCMIPVHWTSAPTRSWCARRTSTQNGGVSIQHRQRGNISSPWTPGSSRLCLLSYMCLLHALSTNNVHNYLCDVWRSWNNYNDLFSDKGKALVKLVFLCQTISDIIWFIWRYTEF